MKFSGITVLTLVGMLLLGVALADAGSQKQTLPRSFGPISLGMTEEAFMRITGVTEAAFCAHCPLNESIMSVKVEKFPGVYPAYLYKLPKFARGFSVSFYKKQLYLIETSPEISEIGAAKKKYTDLFGAPRFENWENGLSFAIWEDKTTALVLTYVRKQDKDQGYPLTMPVGTVSTVEYIDKALRDALEAQEKRKPTREHD